MPDVTSYTKDHCDFTSLYEFIAIKDLKCRRSVIIYSVMPEVFFLLICIHSETDYNFSFYQPSLYYKHQLLFVPFPTVHESTLKWVLSKFEIFSIVLLLPNLRNSMTSSVVFCFVLFLQIFSLLIFIFLLLDTLFLCSHLPILEGCFWLSFVAFW